MNVFVFVIASFSAALFVAIATAYYFINRPRTKEKRKQLTKKIIYWTVVGTLLVCLLAVSASLFGKKSMWDRLPPQLMKKTADPTATTRDNSKYSYLSEEQIRKSISDSLGIEDVDRAVGLLDFLPSDGAKEEECEHIFNFCMQNGKIGKAKEVAELFKSSPRREEANRQIALEMLKKQN